MADTAPAWAQASDAPPAWATTDAPKQPTARSTEGQATPIAGIEDVGGEAYNVARGAIMGPLGNVAGLASIPLHAAGMIDTPPIDVQRKVAGAGAYTPQTGVGRAIENYGPSAMIGKAAEAAGDAVEKSPWFAGHPIAASLASYGTKGAIEQAPALLGAKAGGRIAEGIPGKQAALDVAKGENLPRDALRQELHDADYRTPSEFGLKARASELVGRTKEQKIDSAWNNENATKRLGAEVGIENGAPLIDEVRENAKQQQYKRYDALKQAVGPELQVPNEFRDTLSNTLREVDATVDVHPELAAAKSVLQGFLKRIAPLEARPTMKDRPRIMQTITNVAKEQPISRHAVRSGTAAGNISRTIESAAAETPHHFGIEAPPSVGVPTGTTPKLRTDFVMSQISILRKKAKEDYAKRETERGDARMGIAYQLENLFTENLAEKNRSLVPEWMDARKKLAQLHLLDRITDDTTGKVDLPKLGAFSNKPEYRGVLTGEFKLAADLARNYTKAAQRVTGEAPARLTVLDGLFLAYGVGNAIMGHPGALAAPAIEMAGRLGIPALASRGMLQNRTPSYQVGKARRGLPYALPAAGAAISGQIDQPPQ